MGTWFNNDGLFIRFGTSEAEEATVGEYRFNGPERVTEIELFWSDLSAFTVVKIMDDAMTFGDGVLITKVELLTEEAWDSAADAMTLDIGTIDTDRTTEHDYDGFMVAATETELNAAVGSATPADSINDPGWVGAKVGTVLDNTTPMLITVRQNVATATAGKSYFRIYWKTPAKTTDTLGDVL